MQRSAAFVYPPPPHPRNPMKRQKVLVLYLADSALDAHVIAWAQYDGTGRTQHMAGDAEEPPYPSGLAALRDGWRLIQMTPMLPHAPGAEFTTAYLKYEFLFEQWVDVDG
jgi:hypothetical protein